MADSRSVTDGAATYEKILGKPPGSEREGLRKITVDHLYGSVWNRPGLSIRDRRLITLALLAAQGYSDQLEQHIFGALKGVEQLEDAEILEIMVQVGHYASWAAGTSGAKSAEKVIARKIPVICETCGKS